MFLLGPKRPRRWAPSQLLVRDPDMTAIKEKLFVLFVFLAVLSVDLLRLEVRALGPGRRPLVLFLCHGHNFFPQKERGKK